MNFNNCYLDSLNTWDYMRDAWYGEERIMKEALHKGYIQKREKLSRKATEKFIQSGRYPEVVCSLINKTVARILDREPENIEKLEPYVDDVELFLCWILKEMCLIGTVGLALDLNGEKPRIVQYKAEHVPNWSDSSVAFCDSVCEVDEFGFESDVQEIYKVLFQKNGNSYGAIVDKDGLYDTPVGIRWKNRPVPFTPALRVSTNGKPAFYSLARTSIHYYRMSALRNYILQQMVPQPIFKLPPAGSEGEKDMEELLKDGVIDYGAGTIIVLPHGAEFTIESPVVRPLAEMRQELMLIKDEMVFHGVSIYMQNSGLIGNMSADTLKIHMNDQMESVHDVIKNVENAINKICNMISLLETGEELSQEEHFKFKKLDFGPDEIQDQIDDIVEIAKDIENEDIKEDLIKGTIEELGQRRSIGDD